MTHDVQKEGVALLAPTRSWEFSVCGEDPPRTVSDGVYIYNSTNTTATLASVRFNVPGVQVDVGSFPEVLPPDTGGTIAVTTTRVSDSVGQGTVKMEGTYFTVDSELSTFTFNPTVDKLIETEGPHQEHYVIRPGIFKPTEVYSLTLGQPQILDWITLTTPLTSTFPLTAETEISVTLTMSAPIWLAYNQVYSERVPIILTETGSGKQRVNFLDIEVEKTILGIQLKTTFQFGPLPVIEAEMADIGLIYARLKGCPPSSGGPPPPPSNSAGPSDGWEWTPLPSGGGLRGVRISSSGGGGSAPPFPQVVQAPAQIVGTADYQVRMELSQRLVMQGQGFQASLSMQNLFTDQSVDNIQVSLIISDAANADVTGSFIITPPVPSLLTESLPAGQQTAGDWLILPAMEITATEGITYQAQAVISYTIDGASYSFTTLPEEFTVLPAPDLIIDYELPDPNQPCTLFDLKATLRNVGYGSARGISLSSSQPRVVDNTSSSPIGFEIIRVAIDGAPQAELNLNVVLGDIPPGQERVVGWRIRSTEVGRFIEFTSHYRVDDYYGLPVAPRLTLNTFFNQTSLCGVKQYFLTGECPICGQGDKYATAGGPINTGNGNYTYQQSTPAIPTVSDPLQLQWTYNSLNSGAYPDPSLALRTSLPATTSALGVGWSLNYDTHLDLSGDPVMMRAAHGTPFKFERVGDGFRAAPGVRATLTQTNGLYYVTAPNQASYVFSDTGQILRQLDPQGNAAEFSYDTGGRLERVTESVSGRYLELDYDAEGRLISVTDPASRTTHFGYTLVATDPVTLSLLTTITDTRNQVWRYAYTPIPIPQSPIPTYLLSRITDPDGRVVEETGFDDWGRAISQTYRGEQVSLAYEGNPLYGTGIECTITDGLDHTTTHSYNDQLLITDQADALGQAESYELDQAYNRTFSQDKNGNPTYYERTPMGLTTAITDALGNVTRFEYDERNNLIKATDARGNVTLYLYDGQNNLISTTNAAGCPGTCSGSGAGTSTYTYNERGQRTSATDANGHTTFYGYDTLGQQTVITDALGNVTRFEYDELGRLVKTIDALGQVTLNEYDDGDNLIKVTENYLPGQPQNYQDEYNLVTEYTYNGAGRRLTTKDTLSRVSRNEYDEAGRLERTIQNEHPTETTQNYLNEYNLVIEYEYDEAGNQVVVRDTLNRETRTEYDELNRVERTIVNYVDGVYDPAQPDEDIITRYEYDDNGNLVSTFDVFDRETRTEYDELNRVKRTIVNYQDGVYDPAMPDEDLITSYTYDEVGNQETVTDPLGRVTTYEYDDLNRVETITNPLDGTTSYTYDPVGNRKTITDAENRTTTYDYDALNRVITMTNALGGQTVVVYDEVGNRQQTIDANGHATNYDYDSLYRLTRTTDAENQTTTVTYDVLGNRKTVTDAENHTTTFTYDSLNRMIQTTNPLSGTTRVTYDALGNRLTATDANNHTTTYQYDDLKRPVRVTDANNLTTITVYDGLGNRLSITNGANETTEFEYDQANRLVLTRDPLGQETRFRYNGAGNRVAMIDAEDVETRYGYDDLGRLTSVIENYSDGIYDPVVTDEDVKTEYHYDQVGNRIKVIDARENETGYVYDDLNRRIETRDPLNKVTAYGYDAVGNRTVITNANGIVTTFDYDRVNRLETIDYADTTPDVSFTYDKLGNRIEMIDGTGVTTYTYDALYRLHGVKDGAGLQVGYDYDAVGNRTRLIYPDGREVIYTYDNGNRLDTVTDWKNGQFGYNYNGANRLLNLTLPNGVASNYDYDDAGRLTLLTHSTITETLASYEYDLDRVGNRTVLTETLVAVQDRPAGAYLESSGLVVIEAENGQVISGTTHAWLTTTTQSGYTGTAYLQALPDVDALYQTNEITARARAEFSVNFTSPGTYTVWLRGYASSAAGDSAYVKLDDDVVNITGFAPNTWDWAGQPESLVVEAAGLYTVNLVMREDGLRVDRLLLTTDTNFIPSDFGPAESERQGEATNLIVNLDRTISYEYDALYRLTNADYTSGESYEYEYDPVGNRLQQIINGDTTDYLYDAANRLEAVDGQSYTFDNNGNLLATGVMTNSWDAANRLIETSRDDTTLEPVYNGIGDRVAQTVGGNTTYFALDVVGLPEVIYTGEGNAYLHLPGVIMAENDSGEVQYLLPDGLGSIRQTVDDTAAVAVYNEFDPYGNPIRNSEFGNSPFRFTGEWWQNEVGLLHLRARWYLPETGTFLSRDPWPGQVKWPQSLNGWEYVEGNPINLIDPSGQVISRTCTIGPFNSGFGTTIAVDPYSGIGQVVVQAFGIVVVYMAQPLIEDAVDEMIDIANRAWENWKPDPEPEPTPIPVPIPIPTECPDDDDDDEKEKHISLGHARVRGEPNLSLFTRQLNIELNPLNIYVYLHTDWVQAGLATPGPFSQRFSQASKNAKAIHFSLDGIDNPDEIAERFGNNGQFTSGSIYTAVELYLIREQGYCYKTRFYRKRTPGIGGVWEESISDWLDYCTLTGQGRLSGQNPQN
jgi:RHS repeat-associated protein